MSKSTGHGQEVMATASSVGLLFYKYCRKMRLCQRVHPGSPAVCTRPATNRIRLAGHDKTHFRPCNQVSSS